MGVVGPRIKIYDRDGICIADLRGTAQREWLIDRAGTATIDLPITDAAIREEVIWPTNRVVVESQDVIDWTGVVWQPFVESADKVTITAYGPELLLSLRVVKNDPPNSVGPAAMIAFLMQEVQRGGNMPITASQNIQAGLSGDLEDQLITRGMSIEEALNAIAIATFSEWWLEPIVTNTQLRWELWFQPERVSQGQPIMALGKMADLDPRNGRILSGNIITAVFANYTLGSGQSGSIYLSSDAAKAKYGLMERAGSFEVVSYAQALKLLGTWIEKEAAPKGRFNVKVFPTENSRLALSMKPGSEHLLWADDVGFYGGNRATNTKVRVLAMSYDERTGFIDAVVQSPIDPVFDAWLQEVRAMAVA